jgi:hypothetical protein
MRLTASSGAIGKPDLEPTFVVTSLAGISASKESAPSTVDSSMNKAAKTSTANGINDRREPAGVLMHGLALLGSRH